MPNLEIEKNDLIMAFAFLVSLIRENSVQLIHRTYKHTQNHLRS